MRLPLFQNVVDTDLCISLGHKFLKLCAGLTFMDSTCITSYSSGILHYPWCNEGWWGAVQRRKSAILW